MGRPVTLDKYAWPLILAPFIAAVLIIIVMGIVMFCEPDRLYFGHTIRQRTESALRRMAVGIVADSIQSREEPFSLPGGGVQELEKRIEEWLKEEPDMDPEQVLLSKVHTAGRLVVLNEDGTVSLFDSWGNRLEYQCPAENPGYVFRLYSIGPNGLDEDGRGDDVEGSLLYKDIADSFEDPKFDGNVYRKYRGQFSRIERDGRTLIRHP